MYLLLNACNNNSNKNVTSSVGADTLQNQRFFPVTTYINGQLFSIKEKGINPIKYTTIGEKKDSVFLKVESWEQEMAEFLTPLIDSTNLNTLFVEKSFKDQSLNAITITYDPVKKLPDSLSLSGWTVYINPETGNVKRIYLTKTKENFTTQLTWNSDKNCKMVYLLTNEKGEFTIEKEVLISWDY
ncbi:MAG: hypothetical protein KA319_12015, partial [Ferruginibacter sp.]|nr:hypothetical protein [Ferruginibacter sp.]